MTIKSSRSAMCFVLAVLSACVTMTPACAGQGGVQLLSRRKLFPQVDAMPRIVHANKVQAKINRYFARMDDHASGGACEYFKRTIAIASRGPRFLSLSVMEDEDCGGVHPYGDLFTLTFDLQTGEQVRWGKWLTKVTAEDVSFSPVTALHFSLPGVRSSVLQRLYIQGWKPQDQCDLVVDPQAKNDDELTTFQLAPAPHGGGLSALPVDLASAVAGCAIPVVLNKSAMEELGIPAALQEDLLAAR